MKNTTYLPRQNAVAIYSYATGKLINKDITVGDMEWARKNHIGMGLSVYGCNSFGDFIDRNNIQIIESDKE